MIKTEDRVRKWSLYWALFLINWFSDSMICKDLCRLFHSIPLFHIVSNLSVLHFAKASAAFCSILYVFLPTDLQSNCYQYENKLESFWSRHHLYQAHSTGSTQQMKLGMHLYSWQTQFESLSPQLHVQIPASCQIVISLSSVVSPIFAFYQWGKKSYFFSNVLLQ